MDPTTKQHDVNTRLSAAQSVIQSWLERVLNDWGAASQTMVLQTKTCGEADIRQVSKIGHPKSQPRSK
jgi:hypothetical protein